MNIYWLILALGIALVVLILGLAVVRAVADVKIGRSIAEDPRVDRALRREAKRKVRES